jgi:hypothetical protein
MRRSIMALLLLLASTEARAAVPEAFNVQGVLRDNAGNLQSMMVTVTVNFWSTASGGTTPLATYGPFTNIPVQNGLFSVQITASSPDLIAALNGQAQTYLELIVGNDTFPRQPVSPDIYALMCSQADVAKDVQCGSACVSDPEIASVSPAKLTGAGTAGNFLRANGTNWVSAPVAAGDVQNATQTVADAASITIDPTLGDMVRLNLGATPITSVTFNAGKPAEILTLEVIQDGTGGRTMQGWPGNVRLSMNGAYLPTATHDAHDTLTFRYDSTDAKWVEIGRSMQVMQTLQPSPYPWINFPLPLSNNWTPYSSLTPGFMKTPDGIVYLRGCIQNGTATSATPITSLPAGYIPSTARQFAVFSVPTSSSAMASIEILTSGSVVIGTTITGSPTMCLDGIQFLAEQ